MPTAEGMPTLDDTITRVTALHDGQVDKAGAPYVGHVMRVFRRVRQVFPEAPEDVLHAALLHDVLEDCDVTAADLRAAGYSATTIAIVEAVTKNPDDGLTYAERVERLAATGPRGAVQVKICDLMDNSDPDRLSALPPEQAASLSKRYRKALSLLTERLERT